MSLNEGDSPDSRFEAFFQEQVDPETGAVRGLEGLPPEGQRAMVYMMYTKRPAYLSTDPNAPSTRVPGVDNLE